MHMKLALALLMVKHALCSWVLLSQLNVNAPGHVIQVRCADDSYLNITVSWPGQSHLRMDVFESGTNFLSDDSE